MDVALFSKRSNSCFSKFRIWSLGTRSEGLDFGYLAKISAIFLNEVFFSLQSHSYADTSHNGLIDSSKGSLAVEKFRESIFNEFKVIAGERQKKCSSSSG